MFTNYLEDCVSRLIYVFRSSATVRRGIDASSLNALLISVYYTCVYVCVIYW